MPGQKFGPAWFPGLIAVGLGVCGVLLIVSGWRQHAPWAQAPEWIRSPHARWGITAVLGGLVLYTLAVDALGFHITGVVLLALWMRLLGASWRVAMVVAVIATVVIHFSFYKLLRVPLPWGVLERWAF